MRADGNNRITSLDGPVNTHHLLWHPCQCSLLSEQRSQGLNLRSATPGTHITSHGDCCEAMMRSWPHVSILYEQAGVFW